jgi:hypothetical protein
MVQFLLVLEMSLYFQHQVMYHMLIVLYRLGSYNLTLNKEGLYYENFGRGLRGLGN